VRRHSVGTSQLDACLPRVRHSVSSHLPPGSPPAGAGGRAPWPPGPRPSPPAALPCAPRLRAPALSRAVRRPPARPLVSGIVAPAGQALFTSATTVAVTGGAASWCGPRANAGLGATARGSILLDGCKCGGAAASAARRARVQAASHACSCRAEVNCQPRLERLRHQAG
jgi:hypothetical protein